ncbi:PASTA domain-containing protein [Flavobacteriales bacterium]|nr:PASTA domain-containing protein [Flavobacteriales bacterium]
MSSVFKERSLYKNLVLALVALVLLFLGWLRYLNYYTLHDKFIKVPDFNNIQITKLDSIVEANNIRYVIIDSTFDKNRSKGIVINQDPEPLTDVKRNRKIYLTINSLQSRKVDFPNVFDLTLRQAVRKLEKIGLEVGNLEYRSNIATNKVLGFKVNGISINIGQELYHGTVVDLVVGKGLSIEKVIVPNLIGLSRIEANIILKSASLNIGLEYFNNGVVDSSSTIIYRQYPTATNQNKISIGSSLDLYFEEKK